MGRYPILWAVIPIYGPSSRSMDLRSGLCAFVLIYGPSSTFYMPLSCPMFLHPVLWTVFLFFCSFYVRSFLCAVLRFYRSLSFSTCRHFDLCAFILISVPSAWSMDLHHNLCAASVSICLYRIFLIKDVTPEGLNVVGTFQAMEHDA